MQQNSPDGGPEGRAAARTNLFMAATLHVGDQAQPVKIRDLSAEGAQVESSLSPAVGTAIVLARGRLKVPGHVNWSTESRCGLHFASRVSVREWMANPLNLDQRRVDRVVAVVKAGGAPRAAQRQAESTDGVGEDLTRVAKLLVMLGDALADDPATVIRHGAPLQNLDIAAQTLTALAATMRADDPERAASLKRLDELRVIGGLALQAKP